MNNFNTYKKTLNQALEDLNKDILIKFFETLKSTIIEEGNVIICGNGGSFANSLHIAGDFHKTFAGYNTAFHAIGENFCSLSAIANDFCYEEAITISLLPLIKKKVKTVVIFLSGSGNSKNLINAAETLIRRKDFKENKKYLKTLSFSAYGGGAIHNLVDIPLKIELKDMEIAEDIQLIIFHYLKQELLKIFPPNQDNYIKYNKRVNYGDVI